MKQRAFLTVAVALGACGSSSSTSPAPGARRADATTEAEQRLPGNFRFGDPALIAEGARLHQRFGCTSCHSIDGTSRVGPSHRGVFTRALDRTTVLDDGTVLADLIGPGRPYAHVASYVVHQLEAPNSRVVKDFPPAMPSFGGVIKGPELEPLVVYVESLSR